MYVSYLRRSLAGAATAALAVGLGLAMASPTQAQDTSQVFVVHGIPGQDVDVYVDSDAILQSFAPGEIAGPLDLPAGSYDVAITEPGGDPTDAIISADGVEVPAGANLSLVAHLNEGGEPSLTPFVNDVSEVPAGQARLTARHTAAAPAVDVRAGGEPVFSGLTNPNEETAEVDAGTLSVDVALAGTDEVVLGPADLDLVEGTLTVAYAIGSAEAGTLELLVQTIDGLHGVPDGVPSGTGGLASTGPTAWWFALGGLGMLLVIAATLRTIQTHRHATR